MRFHPKFAYKHVRWVRYRVIKKKTILVHAEIARNGRFRVSREGLVFKRFRSRWYIFGKDESYGVFMGSLIRTKPSRKEKECLNPNS